MSVRRRLLVLDTSYSLEHVRRNKLEASVTCRNLSGYFDAVWTVHPYAPLVTSDGWAPKSGRPAESTLAPGQVFIEGKLGRFEQLSSSARLNFLLAQGDVLTRLARLIRDAEISVIRAGDPLVMGLYAWALSRACRVPFLVRVGGNFERMRQESGRPLMPRLFPSPAVERAVERFVLTRADLVAGANEDNLQYAIELGTARERGTVFRYGNLIDPSHLVPPDQRSGGEELLRAIGVGGELVLVCIGRLLPVKMSDHAVHTLSRLRAEGLDATLVMVGSGAMLPELQALAAKLGVSEHVVFAGERDQQWLSRVIPAADVVLSPFTGRALAEAAFGGAAVVAYDTDWQGELIQSGVNGELVPVGDIERMAQGARKLLIDKAHARRMGEALRTRALGMMSPDALDEHERTEYDRLFTRIGRPDLARSP